MRLDLLAGSFYALSSLWGGLTGTPLCTSSPDIRPLAVHEPVWSPMPRTSVGVMAFVDVNVVPMDTERVLPHQTVVVRDGRITALGASAKVKVPAGALRVDGQGT